MLRNMKRAPEAFQRASREASDNEVKRRREKQTQNNFLTPTQTSEHAGSVRDSVKSLDSGWKVFLIFSHLPTDVARRNASFPGR